MPCFAWTPAQLALMQQYLDDKIPYRAAAADIRDKHKLPVTHNVFAGLVKRGTLRLHPDMVSAHGGRVTVGEMQRRLTLIQDAYDRGDVSGPAIAETTGIPIHQVWRAVRKLKLELKGSSPGKRDPAHKVHRAKRSKTRRKPIEYIDDPVSKIGVHFIDKRPNTCSYIIAKDPDDGLARYCESHRVMRGPYFASAYCAEHHIACHKIEFMEAAE